MIKMKEVTSDNIDFLKMDIEGAEQLAINDPEFPFEKIDMIEISVHPIYGANKENLIEILKNNSFECNVTEDIYSPIILGRKIK